MAQEPVDFTFRLLQEMQATLSDVKQGQQRQEAAIAALRKDIHDWQETIATTSGFAMHANIRNQDLENRIDDLTRRVEALENAP